MKPILLIFSSIFLMPLFGQKLVVGNPDMNVLYRGLGNEIHLVYDNYKNEDLLVQVSQNNTIEYIGDKKYIVRCNLESNKCIIYVGFKKDKGKIWLDSIEYELIDKPYFYVKYGELESGTVDLITFLMQEKLECGMAGYIKNWKFNVTKFNVFLVPKNNSFYYKLINGNKMIDSIKLKIA